MQCQTCLRPDVKLSLVILIELALVSKSDIGLTEWRWLTRPFNVRPHASLVLLADTKANVFIYQAKRRTCQA